MDPRFNDIFTRPENEVFRVVFFPDRIYHARYLNATRSPRYRYNVHEVRGQHDIIVMKGEVYLDGAFLCNFLRTEYRAGRLVEKVRETGRFVRSRLIAWLRVAPNDSALRAEGTVKMVYDPWIDAYQAEIWETLEPPGNSTHDVKVLDMMGRDGQISRLRQFNPALKDLDNLKDLEIAFRENDVDLPFGYRINEPQWDNNFLRSHQVPNSPDANMPQNTVVDENYYLTFQRGWFLNANDVPPVHYRNAMMDLDTGNPEIRDDNILGMRWIIQRELGGDIVYFHQVEIPPGVVEGTHRHIGSEELYYIVEGTGVIYMGLGDDPNPALDQYPTVERDIYGLGKRPCKELPVSSGNVLFTKSGGIHGIKNTGQNQVLKFVAFGYQTS